MKAFKKLCIIITLLFIILTAATNVYMIRKIRNDEGLYLVEAKRLTDDIEETGTYDISQYPHITGVFTEEDGRLFISDNHYTIIEARGQLFRVEYSIDSNRYTILVLNCVLAAALLILAGVLIYIRKHIILPFGKLNSIPQELARGNLAVQMPEEKSRFFGRFTWGVNLLRESIEDSRKKELSMQRDKKLLLLSLSHDIKTPLSAIKLNAKALEKGIYTDEEKRREAAESINKRADEIENFVSQITKAASEDFMNFEVTESEEFLSHIIERIEARYAVQLADRGTEFIVEKYSDCLLSCDPDRLAECLQNLIENAMKYGDGKQIRISFDNMDGRELITVSNTGCTLEEKELTQIFESFQRGRNSDKAPGNGLGLFICKRLMSLMDGEVYADIQNGCFNITLVVKLV